LLRNRGFPVDYLGHAHLPAFDDTATFRNQVLLPGLVVSSNPQSAAIPPTIVAIIYGLKKDANRYAYEGAEAISPDATNGEMKPYPTTIFGI
jgi:hypothetical protein